jgi:hypothetical protein
MKNIRIQCTKNLDGEIIGDLCISYYVYDDTPTVRNLERISSSQQNFMSISSELAFNVRGETVAVSVGRTLVQGKRRHLSDERLRKYYEETTMDDEGIP